MSRYTKEQTEDVARLLAKHHASPGMCLDFADLFAADNPRRCDACGSRPDAEVGYPCIPPNEHQWVGFDRERFLEACGLEPDQPETRHTVPKQVLEHYGLKPE